MKNTIKRIVNSNPLTRNVKNYIKTTPYYSADKKHYNHSKAMHGSQDFAAIKLAHALEKGMSFDNPRPFGKDKVKELIRLFPDIKTENSSAIIIVVNTLREYASFYEKHSWTNSDEYSLVKKFLHEAKDVALHEAGTKMITKEDIMKDASIDYGAFMKSRHSIRAFSKQVLRKEDFKKAIEIARLTPSACNRQMVRAFFCDSKNAKDVVTTTIRHNLSGFDIKTVTPIVITYDASAFDGPRERNQGWLNAGLFTMNLVNAMHSLGIASCICEFQENLAAERNLKKALHIPDSERVAVTIMAGYYRDKNKVYVSQRITADEIMRVE